MDGKSSDGEGKVKSRGPVIGRQVLLRQFGKHLGGVLFPVIDAFDSESHNYEFLRLLWTFPLEGACLFIQS